MKKSQHSVYDLNPHSEYIYDNQKIILHMVPVGDDPNFLKFSVALLLRAEPDGRVIILLHKLFIKFIIHYYYFIFLIRYH